MALPRSIAGRMASLSPVRQNILIDTIQRFSSLSPTRDRCASLSPTHQRFVSSSPTRERFTSLPTTQRFASPSPTRCGVMLSGARQSRAGGGNLMDRLRSISPTKNVTFGQSVRRKSSLNCAARSKLLISICNPGSKKRSKSISASDGGKRNCEPFGEPRCTPEKLAKSDCMKRKREKEGEEVIQKQLRGLWENPVCCSDPCPDTLPRFDELYYRPSDKASRKYQQTWNSCKKKVVSKSVCCLHQVVLPPIDKRQKCERREDKRQRTACSQKGKDGKLMTCKKVATGKCPKITLHGCRIAGRIPPKCIVTRKPKVCHKLCAPYPSFSECQRPSMNPRRRSECYCLTTPMMCEVWQEKRKNLKLQ